MEQNNKKTFFDDIGELFTDGIVEIFFKNNLNYKTSSENREEAEQMILEGRRLANEENERFLKLYKPLSKQVLELDQRISTFLTSWMDFWLKYDQEILDGKVLAEEMGSQATRNILGSIQSMQMSKLGLETSKSFKNVLNKLEDDYVETFEKTATDFLTFNSNNLTCLPRYPFPDAYSLERLVEKRKHIKKAKTDNQEAKQFLEQMKEIHLLIDLKISQLSLIKKRLDEETSLMDQIEAKEKEFKRHNTLAKPLTLFHAVYNLAQVPLLDNQLNPVLLSENLKQEVLMAIRNG